MCCCSRIPLPSSSAGRNGTNNAIVTVPPSSNANAGGARWIAATAPTPRRQCAIESDVALSKLVEVASERAIQWGLLTNGRYLWLYFQARSRAEEF